MRYYCTLFDSNYLSRGLALHASLTSCSTVPIKLFILCMDQNCFESLSKLNLLSTQLINIEKDFMNDSLRAAKSNRSWAEFCWTCSSSLLKFCFQRFNLNQCIYLDSDIYFFSDPEKILQEFSPEDAALITKHNYSSEYDQTKTSGIYCVQFMPFNNNSAGMSVLDDWNSKCIETCELNPAKGICGDQKYLDSWTNDFPNIKVSSLFGAGLAPWNAKSAKFIAPSEVLFNDNHYSVVFYHFHGLKIYLDNSIDLTGEIYEISRDLRNYIYYPYLLKLFEINLYLKENGIQDTHGAKSRSLKLKHKIKRFFKILLNSFQVQAEEDYNRSITFSDVFRKKSNNSNK